MKVTIKWLAVLLLLVLVCAPVQVLAAINLDKMNFSKLASYQTCKKGDSGYNVSRIKDRMQDLGYYRSTATFDDEFNDTMVQRVKLFQENNGLEVNGRVDSSTASKLNASSPVPGEYYTGYWSEPDVALIIPRNTYGEWREKSNDRFNFRIKVKNISQRRTVKAIEFYVFTKDVWGDEIISKSYPYSYTVETSFKPGVMGYTGYMTIPYRRETDEVHIAINKVRYTDGTVETVDSRDYFYWTIRW